MWNLGESHGEETRIYFYMLNSGTASSKPCLQIITDTECVEIVHYLTTPCTIFIADITYHEFNFLPRFCNKYGFCKPEFGSNQRFKPNHMFLIIEYHNFLWMIKLVFGNFFKIWMSVWYIRNKFEHILLIRISWNICSTVVKHLTHVFNMSCNNNPTHE